MQKAQKFFPPEKPQFSYCLHALFSSLCLANAQNVGQCKDLLWGAQCAGCGAEPQLHMSFCGISTSHKSACHHFGMFEKGCPIKMASSLYHTLTDRTSVCFEGSKLLRAYTNTYYRCNGYLFISLLCIIYDTKLFLHFAAVQWFSNYATMPPIVMQRYLLQGWI